MVSASSLVVLAVLLLVAEVFTLSYFFLFIGLGTLVTALFTFLNVFQESLLSWQLFSIACFSLMMVPLVRPFLKQFKNKEMYVEHAHFKPKKGDWARVVQKGLIECNGTMWQAETHDFELESKVEIIGKKGNTFLVQKIE